MALHDTVWYVNYGDGATTGYFAVTKRPQNTAVSAGALYRQFTAPSSGNERVFVVITGGTTANTTDATWTLTRGAKTTDGTAVLQECTGVAAVNGDATNTVPWSTVKNTAVTLGEIIKNVAGTHYFINSTAGTAGNGSEPSWNTTAGGTTNDNTCVWTCIGAVGNFTGWQAPHARAINAIASGWGQNGNTFYLHSAHQETTSGNMNFAIGALGSPCYFLCVGSAHVPPQSGDVTSGATIAEGSASTFAVASATGNVQYWDGINLSAGGAFAFTLGAGSVSTLVYRNGTLSTTSPTINLGSNAGARGSNVTLENAPMSFSGTGQSIAVWLGDIVWRDTPSALAGAAVPTTLIGSTGNSQARMSIRGVDLSAAGSGKTLFSNSVNLQGYFNLTDCKINASVTIGQPGGPNTVIDVVNCDSGAVNYRDERWAYAGSQVVDTGVTRTGGGGDGTTSYSIKIVTTANALWALPFEAQPIPVWIDSAGVAKTITLYGVTTGGSVPNNDEFWMDVEYLSSSSSPIMSRATATKANLLASAAAQSSDASTWSGGTTAFKVAVTVTPQQKGFIYVRPKAAKASATYYLDPQISVV